MPRALPAPRTASILDELPFCFVRATLSFRRFNDQTLRAVGAESMAPGLASILHAAEELGDCTVSRLVAQTHLPNGTLTGLLDALERDGCIQRSRNPADGRSWLIALTRKGRQLCARLQVRHRMVMKVLGEALAPAEVAELTRLLEKATDGMRAYVAEEEAPRPPRTGRKPQPRKAG